MATRRNGGVATHDHASKSCAEIMRRNGGGVETQYFASKSCAEIMRRNGGVATHDRASKSCAEIMRRNHAPKWGAWRRNILRLYPNPINCLGDVRGDFWAHFLGGPAVVWLFAPLLIDA